MKKDGFSWWIDRVAAAFEMYDVHRIDHFRGFASFFAIPYGDMNARGGSWMDAPGIELFDAIKAALPKSKIIAEDLGFITDDVRELLKASGFPGMKVLQFAFYGEDSEYLPRTYTTDNCVVYSGSHDADCTRSWYAQLKGDALKRFKKECPREKGQSATEATVALAMGSRANLCIIPMQDYLELTNAEGRMNTPSTAEGNWCWRISPRYATEKLKNKIVSLTEKGKRV
jgi:4-alpha-glucanotransferase